MLSYKLNYKEVTLIPNTWPPPARRCVAPSAYGTRQMRKKSFDPNKVLAICTKGSLPGALMAQPGQ